MPTAGLTFNYHSTRYGLNSYLSWIICLINFDYKLPLKSIKYIRYCFAKDRWELYLPFIVAEGESGESWVAFCRVQNDTRQQRVNGSPTCYWASYTVHLFAFNHWFMMFRWHRTFSPPYLGLVASEVLLFLSLSLNLYLIISYLHQNGGIFPLLT